MPVIGLCQISSAHKNHEIFRGDTLSRLQARSKIYTKMIESSLVIINYKILCIQYLKFVNWWRHGVGYITQCKTHSGA